MKNVVLLGDSIRLGYQSAVREALRGQAEVWFPGENGQHSVNHLLNFWQWVAARKPDVLHVNFGLWDVRNLLHGEFADNLVPLPHYRDNVRKFLELAQRHSGKVIWATTTPINEAKNHALHRQTRNPARRAADVPMYNAAAVEVARSLGIEIDDLYRFVVESGEERMRADDGVHYKPEAYEALGKKVADVIRPHL